MVKGTGRKAMTGFRPIKSAVLPAGIDPKMAPMAIREPTHDPWSAVILIFESADNSMGIAGDIHASTVPTANGPRVAAMRR